MPFNIDLWKNVLYYLISNHNGLSIQRYLLLFTRYVVYLNSHQVLLMIGTCFSLLRCAAGAKFCVFEITDLSKLLDLLFLKH